MIDFTTQQLTWIVIGACSIGGTGYISLVKTVDGMDTKVAVTMNVTENTNRSLDQLRVQLNRIEEKIDNNKKDK